MNPLEQLLTDLGTLAAKGASFEPANASDLQAKFLAAFEAETTKLAGSKATPLSFVTDAFAIGNDLAVIFNNPKLAALITDLGKTETDASNGAILPMISDLVKDYKAIKGL